MAHRLRIELILILLLAVTASVGVAVAADPTALPAQRHIFVNVANDAGVKYDLDGAAYGGPNGVYFIKADGGGMKELHITNDAAVPAGQTTTTSSQSGTFWITNQGTRGCNDDIVLLVSVRGELPDDFAVHVKSSGYTWTPNNTSAGLPASAEYVAGAIDETFTKADFYYGPQTWKPGPPWSADGAAMPLYYGQDIADTSTSARLMFVDLRVGALNPAKFPTWSPLTDDGGVKVEYSFTNMTSDAAFNGYGWCLAANRGQGIQYTNNLVVAGPSGYRVVHEPLAPPAANFTADVTSGTAPLTVRFDDTSVGSGITARAWDFENDGRIDSTSPSLLHTFSAAGNYTVNLTVTNDAGSDSEVRTDYITVTEPTPTPTPTPTVTPIATVAPESGVLSAPRHIFVAPANGARYDLDGTTYGGPNGTYYIKADGGGLNEHHLTNDVAAPYGQVTASTATSGTFWVTNTGGRGFDDTIVLLVSVQGDLPDDFGVHVKSSGYTWTPNSGAITVPTAIQYTTGAVDETFTRDDFYYGPQTWKPGPGDPYIPSLPLWTGQSISDPSTASHLMFVDLKVGNLKPSASSAWGSLVDAGGAKVEFSFTNMTSLAAFNGYGWCTAASQGSGISWTNRVEGIGNSGYRVTYVPPPAPTAAFTANVTSGTAPLAVAFGDNSTGDGIASWAWDFQDDGVIDSTEQNPTFTYAAAGTYTVNLTVANASGADSEVKTGYITVTTNATPTPTVAFSANVTNGTAPLAVQFTDLSTGSPISWEWSFGDGESSIARHPAHTFLAPGNYTVRLSVYYQGSEIGRDTTGTITVTQAATPTPTPTGNETPTVVQVPGGTGLPTDTNGDELYDDVNGNGRMDYADIVLSFNQMAWIAENEPVSAFDYNANGRIDFGDMVWLFNHL
ncbi:MAG: PKD domain-containing protein [Methanospirillum sp.]